MTPTPHRVGILGASGGVGRRIAERLIRRGTPVRCQTRTALHLADIAEQAEVCAFEPTDAAALRGFVRDCGAVVYALGIDRLGATTLFSASTAALIGAMQGEHVDRLIAVTGVGAGETRGHGGFVYDRIVFPLFTRPRYADKDAQEALIARSGLRWTIVRPAPFRSATPAGPLEAHATVADDTVLTGITRDEVAQFVIDELDHGRFIGERPFIGHRG